MTKYDIIRDLQASDENIYHKHVVVPIHPADKVKLVDENEYGDDEFQIATHWCIIEQTPTDGPDGDIDDYDPEISTWTCTLDEDKCPVFYYDTPFTTSSKIDEDTFNHVVQQCVEGGLINWL